MSDHGRDQFPGTTVRITGDEHSYVGFVGVVGAEMVITVPCESRADAATAAAQATDSVVDVGLDLEPAEAS